MRVVLSPLLLLLTLIAAVMICFCVMTPLAADDFYYALSVGSFAGIPAHLAANFAQWTGRLPSILISDILVLSPQWLQALAAPAAFMLLYICMLQLIHGRAWRQATTPMQALFLFAALWSSIPAFGTVFFWRVGTAHYLWTHCFLFLFMARCRLLLDKTDAGRAPTPLRVSALCLLALLAGWSIETACVLPLCYLGALYWYAAKIQRRPLPAAYLLCGVPALAGVLLLLLAPGNFARMAHESEHVRAIAAMGVLEKLPYYFDKMLMGLGMYFPVVLCLAALLWRACRRPSRALFRTDPRAHTALLFLLFAFMSTGAFFFSPSYPLRAFTSLVLCHTVAATALLAMLEHDLPGRRLLAAAMAVALLWSVGHEMSIFRDNYQISRQRAAIVAAARGGDAVFPLFTRQDKFFFAGKDIKDVRGSEGTQARYYGLRSVRATGPRDAATGQTSP